MRCSCVLVWRVVVVSSYSVSLLSVVVVLLLLRAVGACDNCLVSVCCSLMCCGVVC